MNAWLAYTRSEEFAAFTRQRQDAAEQSAHDVDTLRAELARLRERLTPLLNLCTAGELTETEWKATRASLVAEVAAREQALERAKSESVDVGWWGSEGLPATAWQMAQEANDLEARRKLLRSLIERVIVHPAKGRGRSFDPPRLEVITKAPDGLHPGEFGDVRWGNEAASA